MDESDGGPTVMHWFRERPTLLLWTRSASFLRCSMQGWSAVAGGWPDRLAVDGVAYGSARGGGFIRLSTDVSSPLCRGSAPLGHSVPSSSHLALGGG